jgi:membrane-bound lytic murein transglycosylase MltF
MPFSSQSRPEITRLKGSALALGLLLLLGCDDSASGPPEPPAHTMETPTSEAMNTNRNATSGQPLLSMEELGLPPELAPFGEPVTGDFDAMVERRIVRILTVYQLGGYFLDGPQQKGLTYDLSQQFEQFINEKLKTRHLKVHVVLVPVEFDRLIDALEAGYGDIIAAGMSITDDRLERVDFSDPLSRNISEIIVSGPSGAALSSLSELAGRRVYTKPGSSYISSLRELNADFTRQGLEPVDIVPAPQQLDDEDLLEMVSADLLPLIAMDSYKARFWAQVLPDIHVHEDLVIRSGRRIAWAFRKESPLLAQEVNAFIKTHRQGTLIGNVLIKRYFDNADWVARAMDPDELSRFNATIHLFQLYGDRYGFDPLLIAAQGYQESKLDQSVRSPAGAIGVMQLLPSTAADPNVGISNIEELEPNIHAGAKYLRFLRDRYFSDTAMSELNQTLFSFAAYNAGPARVRKMRDKARDAGLDPNIWFKNVELIAAREIGRETVQYVSNIYKYYVAYSLVNSKRDKAPPQ